MQVDEVKITFGMIVLNGFPFLEYNLRNIYPYAHEIIVVEGACKAAVEIARKDGHSIDGTFERIQKIKEQIDKENKISIVQASDEGFHSGFWPEKDEMSQAYAKRATGNWLWQIDYDEFYKGEDIEKIKEIINSNPSITSFSFRYKQFWGSFDFIQKGEWFDYEHKEFHRLFKWGKGFQYVMHRPPTVFDSEGQDLRTMDWWNYKKTRSVGIFLYHYSYVFPIQAQNKVGYYPNVNWSDEFRNAKTWYKDSYIGFKNPFRIDEAGRLCWIKKFEGDHPKIILELINDLRYRVVDVIARDDKDLKEFWSSKRNRFKIILLKCWLELKKFKRQAWSWMLHYRRRIL